LKPDNTIKAILDALASQNREETTSLIFRLQPDLIQEAMNALRDYRKVFAPVISGLTDISSIYAAYEQMRKADGTNDAILLLVECQTERQFREALETLPIRKSSEWHLLTKEQYDPPSCGEGPLELPPCVIM
jgi:hypothetical protein